MSLPKRTLSLVGCRTRAEAVARLRPWLTEIAEDAERKLVTDLLTGDHGGHEFDADAIDLALATAREMSAVGIETALEEFERFMDREFGPKR